MMAAISALATYLGTLLRNSTTWFYNVLVDCAQVAFNHFIDFVIGVIALFPNVPLPSTGIPAQPEASATYTSFFTAMNWLFPVSYVVLMVGFLVASILAYWIIAPLARWLKLLT